LLAVRLASVQRFLPRRVDEALELAPADGVLELADGLGLDLMDALATHLSVLKSTMIIFLAC